MLARKYFQNTLIAVLLILSIVLLPQQNAFAATMLQSPAFSDNASLRLYYPNLSYLVAEVCADNLNGHVVHFLMEDSDGNVWENSLLANNSNDNCVTADSRSMVYPISWDKTYTVRAALDTKPDASWPVPCFLATGGAGLCAQAKFAQSARDPLLVTPTPTDVTPEPTDITPTPTDVTPTPTDVTPEPTDVTPTPTDVTPEPTDVTPTPTDVTPEPTDVTPTPTDVTPTPTEETPTPSPDPHAGLVCPASVKVGDAFTCSLTIDPKTLSVSGVEITLGGLSDLVEVTGITPTTLAGEDSVFINNQTDTNGERKLALAGSNGFKIAQSGDLLTISLTAKQSGTVTLTGAALVADEGSTLTEIAFNGATINFYTGIAALKGKVNLYANVDPQHVVVALLDSLGSEVANATPGADGTYSLAASPADYKIKITLPGYLVAEKDVTLVSDQTLDVGSVTLAAGDINADGVIDPLDVMNLGTAYNADPIPPALLNADLNFDGKVNLLDLVLLAINYRKVGPTQW
jgi:hypothetical protein